MPGDRDDDALFLEAMSDVVPLQERERRAPRAPRTRRPTTEKPPSFVIDDDGARVEGRRGGVSRKRLRAVRDGAVEIEATLDLHGMRAADARRAVRELVDAAHAAGQRCVRIVHGRGLHSGDAGPVLRGEVLRCLTSLPTARRVQGFCTAASRDGGAGALLVLVAS